MPGPGKRKSKAKKATGGGRDLSNVDIPTLLDAFIDEINSTRDWADVVHLLCRMFELPDLDKRSGLKKYHANFDQIHQNLENAYNKYIDNEKVTGGIVGIWAAMCADVILRNRLVKAGLVEKMLPLFDKKSTRYVGLQALSTVTHHGGADFRREIARQTPTLVRLMEEFPDDTKVNELIVATLAHTTSAVVNDDESSASVQERNMSALDIPSVLRLVLRNIRNPKSSGYLLTHALELFSTIAIPCHREIKALPPLVRLMTASLRSKEVALRCTSLGGLFRLVQEESDIEYGHLDPNTFIAAVQRGFPDELSDILMNFGPARCDTYIILKTGGDFQKAMQKCVQDHDLYALGNTLVELVLRTEFAITEGMYQSPNPTTGVMEVIDIGLPFQMWSDSLPHCSKALRKKGSSSDLDKADILECKFLIMRQRLPEALALARKAVERSPEVSYFYYVIGLTAKDLPEGLRASKKGLKSKQMSLFIKTFLLWRGTEHAAQLGLLKLQNSRAGDAEYSEGIAFLTSALEDTRAYITEASPDSRHMSGMLSWHILLTIALRGPELSLDLTELNPYLKQLETTRKFGEFFGTPYVRTQLRLTRELVMKQYKASYTEWQPLIERLDTMYASGDTQLRSTARAGDNLEAWLEGLSVDDGEHDGPHARCYHPKLGGSTSLELYRCAYCGNPSAALRKCSGCAKTKYCDSSCQKSHWPEHRVACKKAQAES
ncbi:hypothetical protein BDW22DRAFT_414867 [Trametopsis cervina]|nr:hypothetical protein BDW22DRAFT_414867 [Trametopsis cervina]